MEFSVSSVAILFLLFVICSVTVGSKPHKRYPPGPTFALPLLGNLLQLGSKPHLTIQKWRRKYGPVFSFKMANMNAVVVSDPKLARELFSKEDASGRMQNAMMDAFGGGCGIFVSEGRIWAEQRPFALKTLKSLSKGGTLEAIVQEEGSRLVKHFETQASRPVQVAGLFVGPLVNIIWRLISGENHDWMENPGLPHITNTSEFSKAVSRVVETGLFFAPFLRHVIPELSGFNRLVRACNGIRVLARNAMRPRLEQSAGETEAPPDFIGEYLKQVKKELNSESSFYKEFGLKNLEISITDLFSAATDTTASTLEHALLYLSQHREVQVEMQKEIDSLLGSRLPSISDRLPYTEAVILETMRRSAVVLMGLPHRALNDIEFRGYHIPKDTLLITDIYGMHHNPEVWGPDAGMFRPERFLNGDKTTVVRNDSWVPFSIGKRQCIGEAMAKNTLFLFLTIILQNFSVNSVPGTLDMEELVPGLVSRPKPFQVEFRLRNPSD